VSYRVLLGIADPDRAAGISALVHEDSEFAVVDVAADTEAVVGALSSWQVDVVVLHEDLGPLPIMDLAREVAARFPDVGVVLLVRDATRDVLRSALQAGVRDVLPMPASFEDLQAALYQSIQWSTALRERIAAGEQVVDELQTVGGRMVAVAGQLAMAAVTSSRDRSVCLVDLDLQTGDVAAFLDLTHHRTIVDLLEMGGDIGPRQLENTLFVHASGLRVLLPPQEGELGEEVNAEAARRILGAIKSQYDVVVVDVGSVLTEAGAVAVEMSDESLLVLTPDVPSLRAANRQVSMWERLRIKKKDDLKVVLNRVSRTVEIQPDVVARVVAAPSARASIPAGFREVEAAANTGMPARLADGPVLRAIGRLGAELGLTQSPAARRWRKPAGEQGSLSVETAGLFGIILLVTAVLWQIVLTGFTFVLAGHAAREGARQLAVDAPFERQVREELPLGWREGARVTSGEDYVEVSLAVPAIVPGLESPVRFSVRAGTVVEEEGP
jgi:pilus assembly protein CpaE